MTVKGYATPAPKSDAVGDVIAHTVKTMVIELGIQYPPNAGGCNEVIVNVNGRQLTRMHVERARRLGLVNNDPYMD